VDRMELNWSQVKWDAHESYGVQKEMIIKILF